MMKNERSTYTRKGSGLRIISAAILMAFVFLCQPFNMKAAQACGSCSCVTTQHATTQALIITMHELLEQHITFTIQDYESWFMGANGKGPGDSFFHDIVLPSLMMTTEQLTQVGMQQMAILGAFFDAKHELEVQRLYEQKMAEAHKDYHPSNLMCTFGTVAKSLAASDRMAEVNAFALSQRSQDRQLGTGSVAASEGDVEDHDSRTEQFRRRYCDKRDNLGQLGKACDAPIESVNKDIDFGRTIDGVKTLYIDFSNGTVEGDEEDVLAFISNIFANDITQRINNTAGGTYSNQDDYMRSRAVVAKRSVAENSLYTIIGLKAAGPFPNNRDETTQTGLFLGNLLAQLGVTDDDAQEDMLGLTFRQNGEKVRPSYYAQMEAIAQKVYQQPDFYANLYDKPANIARKEAAMQAIGLMLGRDTFKSELRSEAVLSVLLENEITKFQDGVEDRIGKLEPTGRNN